MIQLKSETAKAICRYYFKKNCDTSIFRDADAVERAINLSIVEGAKTATEVRNETINILEQWERNNF